MINMKKIINLTTYLFIIIVIAFIAAYFLAKNYSNKISNALYSYSESESKKVITEIINLSLTEELENDDYNTTLYNIVKNDKDEIQLIDFNTTKVNKILSNLTNNIENKIKNMESSQILEEDEIMSVHNGLIFNMPIGAVTGNVFLSNIGTKIPVKISLMGSVISKMDTSITEYGLNNALIKIGILVTVNTKTTAPFTSKEFTVTNTIPISIKVIQGSVPEYYLNSLNDNKNNN